MVDRNLIADLDIDDNAADQMIADAFGGQTDTMESVLSAQLGDYTAGAILKGKIIGKAGDDFLVEVGLKSEGILDRNEFDSPEDVEIGDTVEVLLESIEDEAGGVVTISKRKADRIRGWERIVSQNKENDVVEGKVMRKIKGGLLVDIGVPVFLPASQVDIRRPADIGEYIGRVIKAQILKIDEPRRNIVISRRKLIEEERTEKRKKLLQSLKEGDIVKGTVKNITDYGAFVDLGGIDGLLHITDLAWRRVRHPSEVVQVGQEITAKVLKFDQEKNRVSLGVKQLGEDPWVGLARRYPQGTRLFGKVTNITDYGAFVEIEAGIEGLVHVSEMDWTNKNVDPKKVVQLGDEVEVMVLEIDEDRRRISLGMKQCKPNPWEDFSISHKKGDKVKGQIKSITDFGVFIGLPGGIDGLVHLSDLSWNEPGEEAVRKYKKGDEVEAVVLAIDTERERISLGVKQLGGDPFTNYAGTHEKGQLITGAVKSVDAKGAVVSLGGDVEGYLRASEISPDRVEDARTHLKEGDSVTAMIINVDRKTRSINLSIKAKDNAETAEQMQRMQAEAQTGTTNLGALLKAKLDTSKNA